MYRNSALILILSLISYTSMSIVKWLPDSSFNLPINFKDAKLPCSKQTVVFPQTIMGSVRLEAKTQVGGLILPQDGEIVLNSAEISFGEDPNDSNCAKGNAYYVEKSMSSWIQPDVWNSPRFNKATPDSERIPCHDDRVEFPDNTKFTVILPDVTQTIGELRIGNQSYNTAQFRDLIQMQSDQMQQFILNNNLLTGIDVNPFNPCLVRKECPCQGHGPTKIDCTLKFCPEPTCVEPIKPEGYCCKFCGGFIRFQADDSFNMISFKELIDNTVDSYSGNVVYHVSVISLNPKTVQLVIVDTDEYEGSSTQAVNYISNKINDYWVKSEKLMMISGGPVSKAGLGGKIFISMFFAVVCVMAIIYLYYYKLPDVRYPIFNRGGPRGVFSRFQRRTDSVVSLTRRDSGATIGSRPTAFRNPLYNSKRGRVEVIGPVEEECEN